VELTYINEGTIDHTIDLEGVVDEVKVRPGATHVFTFTIQQPGEYKYICALPGHELAGMVGVLRVEE
jgi:uncharacterized cupredoxin-like copper-binding protein